MPLNNTDTNTWFQGQVPTGSEIQSDAQRAQQDPLGWWWDTVVNGRGAAGRTLAASGGTANPTRTTAEAGALGAGLNMAGDVRNADAMDSIYRAGAQAGPRANPYSTVVADQSRPAQLALMAQMRQQMAGPSIAGMQGQRAMGAAGQQALMQGGRAGMLGAQNASAGLAGDVGQARLAEIMRAQAGLGGAAGNLRGADLRSAGAQMQSGLDQRRQDDMLRQFYAQMGAQLENSRLNTRTARDIVTQQARLQNQQRDANTIKQGMGTMASVLGMGATGG